MGIFGRLELSGERGGSGLKTCHTTPSSHVDLVVLAHRDSETMETGGLGFDCEERWDIPSSDVKGK